MKRIYISVEHTQTPNDTFYVSTVDVDKAFNVDWDLTNVKDQALEVETIETAKAVIACIKASKIIKGYTFKIIEVTTHETY